MEKLWNSYLKGLRDGVAIGLGYLSVSFTFGMMATKYGIPVWATVLISMTNLTSAGQFAGLSLIASGGGFVEMAITQLVINLRYSLMSLSLSQRLDKSVGTGSRFLMAFGNTDEIFAVSSSRTGKIGSRYFYGLMTAPYLGWALGTLAGATISTLLPTSVQSALGIAIYGMFLAIIIPPARKKASVATVTLISVAMSCAFYWLPSLKKVSSGFVIIICAVVASAIGALVFPVKDGDCSD